MCVCVCVCVYTSQQSRVCVYTTMRQTWDNGVYTPLDVYMCINKHHGICSHVCLYTYTHPYSQGVRMCVCVYTNKGVCVYMSPANMYTRTSIFPGSTDMYMCINSHGSMCKHVSHKHAYTSSHKHVSHEHGSTDVYMCINKHGSMCIHVSHEHVPHEPAHTSSHKHGGIHVYTCMCLCLCLCLFIHIYTSILSGLYGWVYMGWLRLVGSLNYRSLLQKSPTKETIFCKRDL